MQCANAASRTLNPGYYFVDHTPRCRMQVNREQLLEPIYNLCSNSPVQLRPTFSLCSNVKSTTTKNRPRLSLQARWPAKQALSKRASLCAVLCLCTRHCNSDQSWATLVCAHGTAILTNSGPCATRLVCAHGTAILTNHRPFELKVKRTVATGVRTVP